MRLEGDDAQQRPKLVGRVAGDIDHRLMPQVHPVEIADRGAGAAIPWLGELVIPDDPHDLRA
jgi:hypothetical protein